MERKSACSLIVASAGPGVRRVGSAFLAGLFCLLLIIPLSAQQDDPSEIFLKAYLSAQQGEKLERENRFKTALAKFRFAGSLIEELRRSHSDWQPAIVEYAISEQDVKGPFAKTIPRDLEKMARLGHLSYTSPLELLGEKFHVDPSLLKLLNPGKRFDQAGSSIRVPNVGERDRSGRVAKIEVDKSARDLRALAENGELIAFYPASIGSEEKPAPSGQFKVRRIAHDPAYHYDPKFKFKGVHAKHKLTIAPGPNNPVGVVWIDLTRDSYGIHGTPDPERIGKTYSHGCIRLTNWDALDLAKRVRKGTPVDFVDEPSSLPTREGPGEARGRE